MKITGVILLAIGIALLFFVGYSYVKESSRLRSPVPEDRGVKVIFETPTP